MSGRKVIKCRPARRTRAGAYTVAKIDKMNKRELFAAVRILAAEYKRTPATALGTIIQYMVGRL